ncbi:MAG: glycoside hydrolase family 130 protein [Bacillota bacterium]
MAITKYSSNPILTKENVPFRVNSIFNAGAVKHEDEYILLCRVEMPNGRSSFVLARSKDGYSFEVDRKPCLSPEDHGEFIEYVEWGIEDPRITKIKNRYYITYTGYSDHMPLVMLAETGDFKKFDIIGPITEPSNKDCAIFPEKIDGYYWKVDRPSNESRNYIWINKSPDLLHWGEYRFVLGPTPGTWEADKVGGSTPPVRTKQGWLMLYHGVRGFGISNIYKISVLLLDLKKPWKVIGKSSEPILQPDLEYERVGDVGNVVFTNGWVADDNGGVKVYYSGADTNICLATTTVEYLLSLCK